MEIPAKIQIKHLGNLERIHRQNLKFIDYRCARSLDFARSRSRQDPLCPPSAGSRGLLPYAQQ